MNAIWNIGLNAGIILSSSFVAWIVTRRTVDVTIWRVNEFLNNRAESAYDGESSDVMRLLCTMISNTRYWKWYMIAIILLAMAVLLLPLVPGRAELVIVFQAAGIILHLWMALLIFQCRWLRNMKDKIPLKFQRYYPQDED